MKFTAVMYDEGDRVQVTDGDFKTMVGTVVGWGHISGRDGAAPDILHIVKLDKPVKKMVTKKTDIGGGKSMSEEEEVTFEQCEAPQSKLAPAA